MSKTPEKICLNCINYIETTDQKRQPVHECCRIVFGVQNNMNVHYAVRRPVNPYDTCDFFTQKTR